MNKYFVYFVKFVISVGFVFYLFKKTPLSEVSGIFLNINHSFLIIGILIFVFCWLLNSKKWGILLSYIGFKEKTNKLFKLNLISIFYASILPGGQLTGETIKCYKITKDSDEKAKLVFSVFMDRITGLIAIIFLGLIGVVITDSVFSSLDKIRWLFVLGTIGSVLFLLFYVERIAKKAKGFFDFYQGRFRKVFDKILNLFFIYEGAYKSLFLSIIYSLVFQALNTMSVYFLALAISLNLNIFDLFWINALVSVILVLPITVMGLGLREGSFVFLLGLLGVTNSSALSLSLLVSVVYLFIGLSGGVIELYEFLKVKNQRS